VGASDDERKKFLVGMVMDHNTLAMLRWLASIVVRSGSHWIRR
jgi:hypothetical protein